MEATCAFHHLYRRKNVSCAFSLEIIRNNINIICNTHNLFPFGKEYKNMGVTHSCTAFTCITLHYPRQLYFLAWKYKQKRKDPIKCTLNRMLFSWKLKTCIDWDWVHSKIWGLQSPCNFGKPLELFNGTYTKNSMASTPPCIHYKFNNMPTTFHKYITKTIFGLHRFSAKNSNTMQWAFSLQKHKCWLRPDKMSHYVCFAHTGGFRNW